MINIKKITLEVKNEERSMLLLAIKPPKNVVNLIPIRSLNIPDTIDNKNVVPIVNEPIRAEKQSRNIKG